MLITPVPTNSYLRVAMFRLRRVWRGVLLLAVTASLCYLSGPRAYAQAFSWKTVAHWQMNETTGGIMKNRIRTSPNGIWHNIIPGRLGFRRRAYGFNGFSSYVEVPNDPVFDFGTDSIRVIVQIRTPIPGRSIAGDDIVKKGYFASSSGLFKMEFYPDGRISCAFRGTKSYTGDIFSQSSVVTRPPTYRTVECVLDRAAKQARVIVDGVIEGQRLANVGPIFASDPLLIGAYPGAGFFEGALDEIVIQRAACPLIQCPIHGLEYIASYPDLILAFGANENAGQAHYAQFGKLEGRIPYGFNPVQYLAKYGDLQAAFGSDTEAALMHYIQNGFFEGRTDLP